MSLSSRVPCIVVRVYKEKCMNTKAFINFYSGETSIASVLLQLSHFSLFQAIHEFPVFVNPFLELLLVDFACFYDRFGIIFM